MQIHLTFIYSAWFVLLGLVLLSAFAWWVYRYTTPRVSGFLRKVLMILRIGSIGAILTLLFEPVLTLVRHRQEKPVIAMLIDTSASMRLGDSTQVRSERLQALLKGKWLDRIGQAYEIAPIAFADRAELLRRLQADSLQFDGDGTNLMQAIDYAIETFAGRNLSAMLIFSDGVQNFGKDPSLDENIPPLPLYTVGFGADSAEKDTWIETVLANEIAYANTKIPVEVLIRSTGYANRPAQISLYQGNTAIAARTLTLPGDFEEARVRFEFVPTALGMQKYEVRLAAQPGEVTAANNRRTFYTRVQKSKLKSAIIAGAPGADVAFLLRVLQRDENLAVQAYVALDQKKIFGGRLPGDADIPGLDCIIALNMGANKNRALDLWLEKAVNQQNKPLFFISGPLRQASEIWKYRAYLPLAARPVLTQEKQVLIDPTARGIGHPILRVRDAAAEVRAALIALPPFFSRIGTASVLPGAQILAYATTSRSGPAGRRSPALIAHRRGGKSTLLLLGAGFWRWHLMMQKVEAGNDVYEKFMLNAIRWLVSSSDSRLFKVSTDKDVYRTGEDVLFSAQAYFEDLTPRDNLEIELKLSRGATGDRLALDGRGEGLYAGRYMPLAAGDYHFSATAREGDAFVAADSGRFTVDTFNIEFQQTAANFALLQKIAAKSGGAFIRPDSVGAWAQHLQLSPREYVLERKIELWNKWVVLFAVVLLLSLEWLIRKREGML